MNSPWFYAEKLPQAGESWLLSRDEAKHATGAKRLGPGDEVILFDGSGHVAAAALGSVRGRDGSTQVAVLSVRTIERTGRLVHLATALPKGDRLSTLVDMTTQLGVASMTALRCERSVVSETDARADRIRRIQIEACKQARCPWLPSLHPEMDVATLAKRGGSLVVFHPGGVSASDVAATLPGEVTIAVGPEGGFTDAEATLLQAAGATVVSLGETILRIETAAVVGVAQFRG